MSKEKNMIEIPEEAIDWVSTEGFIQLYITHVAECSTNQAAYEAAEDDYQKVFRKRKYSSWESFLQIKWRHQTKKKRVKQNKH